MSGAPSSGGLTASLDPHLPGWLRPVGRAMLWVNRTMLGLGISIDYALLIVTRYREELLHHDVEEAVARSQEIADSVDIQLQLGQRHFPTYPLPEMKTAPSATCQLRPMPSTTP